MLNRRRETSRRAYPIDGMPSLPELVLKALRRSLGRSHLARCAVQARHEFEFGVFDFAVVLVIGEWG